jgi:hypothetical protein
VGWGKRYSLDLLFSDWVLKPVFLEGELPQDAHTAYLKKKDGWNFSKRQKVYMIGRETRV